ncbi:MAG: helix-hairpin-helix domain-containing protein [Acidobacteria bacterium]|nr:helix-hairpin-helix domain-containing protein [Acidobacteriota bacterium]
MVKQSIAIPSFVLAFALAAHAAAATQEEAGLPPAAPVAEAAQEASTETPAESPSGVVNINTATAAQLQLLPGVGPSRAQAIIERREEHPYRRPEDLLAIRGIGRSTLTRLLPYITVDGDTTLTRPVPGGRTTSHRR